MVPSLLRSEVVSRIVPISIVSISSGLTVYGVFTVHLESLQDPPIVSQVDLLSVKVPVGAVVVEVV